MGDYTTSVPPLTIPNREVKPSRADDTVLWGGKVGVAHLIYPNLYRLGFFIQKKCKKIFI